MALLCGGADTDIIKLLGRWQSDAMIRYLHQDATPIMSRLAIKMFNNGSYSFLPEATVPAAIQHAIETVLAADSKMKKMNIEKAHKIIWSVLHHKKLEIYVFRIFLCIIGE